MSEAKRCDATSYDLGGAVGHLLRRCQQRAVDVFVEEVGENGPTPRQFAILLSVYQNPGINQTDLVRLSGIDRSTLTEILRRMVSRGLLRRSRQPNDQRSNAIHVTAEGEAMLRRAIPAVDRVQERLLDAVAPSDRAAVVRLLEQLARTSDTDAPRP